MSAVIPSAVRLQARRMEGRHVTLEPLEAHHEEGMRAAANQDPATFDFFPSSATGERFDAFWATMAGDHAAGLRIVYAVRRRADDRIVGTSSFLHMRPGDRGAEIGSTFLQADARGGPVNPEMKRLMLGQAFDAGLLRVELVTDARNLRSQAAIAKLGAVREGVLRRHKITWTGFVRDTVVFSILDTEWPAVRDRLDRRLEAFS